ncbi:hypothetical protein FOZ62_007776 [Perkinsus olseni]|uniref:Uncharacterized protein n=1 Tax=Perkinsus olseni TaxID=32597 RepID=A0A7J6QX66_PEROL|nr:hypothetical protein FOZ62_007776 [Perkinsus olseni]
MDREELSKSVGGMGLGVGVGTKLMPGGQRIKNLVVTNCKMPLVAKILLTTLRLGTTVDTITLRNLGLTDNMTDVLSEFIMTYVLRHPTLSLDLSDNHLTDVCANRLLTAVSTGASGARVSLWLGGNCIKDAEKIASFDSTGVQVNDGRNGRGWDRTWVSFIRAAVRYLSRWKTAWTVRTETSRPSHGVW